MFHIEASKMLEISQPQKNQQILKKLSSITQPLSKRENVVQRNWPYDARAHRQLDAHTSYNLRNSTNQHCNLYSTSPTT